MGCITIKYTVSIHARNSRGQYWEENDLKNDKVERGHTHVTPHRSSGTLLPLLVFFLECLPNIHRDEATVGKGQKGMKRAHERTPRVLSVLVLQGTRKR